MSSFLDSIPRIVGTVADALPIVASEPLHDAADVQRERNAAQSRTGHAREPDACDPLLLAASGISAIVAEDKLGQVLAAYRAPRRAARSSLDPRTVALREEAAHNGRCDAIGRACETLATDTTDGNPDGRPWCCPPWELRPRGDAFERGDASVWHALAVLAARGMRALVVRVDGSGEATARRVPVGPYDEAVSHALAMAYGVADRGWKGKRGRPENYGALIAMLRAIIRRQTDAMHRVRSQFDARAADQAELDTLAARCPDAAREAARETFVRAMARAVAQTRADGHNGARTRRRLAAVAAEFSSLSPQSDALARL